MRAGAAGTRTGTLVSVVVPCFNEADHIAGFLESLRAQELPDEVTLEVLIAEGMSDDGTREILRREACDDENVRVLDNPDRIVSIGLNRAIEAARGDVVVRMDVHTRYAPDYIRECLAALERIGAAAVGGPWHAVGHDPTSRAVAAAFHSRFGMGGGLSHRRDHEGPVDTVYLGCWRRETLEDVGGFDPVAVRSQDAELSWRIRQSGGLIWQTPRIRSWYTPRNSFRAVFRQFYDWGYWKLRLMLKNPGGASPRHLVPSAMILGAVLLTTLSLLDRRAGLVPLGLAGLYAAAASAAAAHARHDAAGWRDVPQIAVAFAVFHLAYGYGLLRALAQLALGRYPGWPDGAVARVGRRADYLLTLGTELAVLAAALIVFRLAAVAWGATGFGEYVLARRAISLLQPPLLVGMGTAVARFTASAGGTGRGAGFLTPGTAIAAATTALGILLLNLWPAASAALLLGGAEAAHLVGPISWAVAGFVLHGLAYAELRGRMAMRAANGLQAANLGAAPVAALLVPGLDPAGVVALTGMLWCGIGGGALLWRLVAERRDPRGVTPSRVRTLLAYGVPRVPGELGFALLLALPVILAAHAAGPEMAGFVGLGISLVRMMGAFFAPLGKVLLPAAATALAAGDRQAVRRATRALSGASLLLTGVGAAILLAFAPRILELYLGPGFDDAAPVVRALAVGAVPFALFIVLRNVLDAAEVRPLNTRNTAIALAVLALLALPAASPTLIALAATAAFTVLGALSALDARRLLRPEEPGR